jgi:hypothetical protein
VGSLDSKEKTIVTDKFKYESLLLFQNKRRCRFRGNLVRVLHHSTTFKHVCDYTYPLKWDMCFRGNELPVNYYLCTVLFANSIHRYRLIPKTVMKHVMLQLYLLERLHNLGAWPTLIFLKWQLITHTRKRVQRKFAQSRRTSRAPDNPLFFNDSFYRHK